MSQGSKRVKSSRHQPPRAEFGASAVRWKQPLLVTATDVCLWLTMIAVAIGFGGRMANGQLALVIGASLTAFCWLLYQFTSSEPRYSWTGSEFCWLAGLVVGVAQIVPLPAAYLVFLSPHLKNVLPLWFDPESANLFPEGWNQLSLAPWETASGLATFISYALIFLVVTQRTRSLSDVESTLCYVAIASVAMMIFSQMQFLCSNGKFFWTYDHPFMMTDSYPLGCFTNRNHLAQFLALGTGPLIWWMLRRFHQQQLDQAARRGLPGGLHLMAALLLLSALVAVAMTVLMTLSRGGLIALALATIVSIGLMCRFGLASLKFGLALLLVTLSIGVFFSFSKYESILAGRLEQNSGRTEIWQANIAVARDFALIGTGIGTHGDAYQLHIKSSGDDGHEYTHAECGYLQVASESGIAGLFVAGMMIATSFWWCVLAFRNPDLKSRAAASAILASLVANIAQAVGDFFWYTPSCMLLLAMQLACAVRLSRLARQETGMTPFTFRLPRFMTAGATCCLIPLAIWMFDLKFPAALAEPHRMQELRLTALDEKDLTEEEQQETAAQRMKETLLAAKLNPRDAKLQESASSAYMRLFELKQERSENTMSASMLRDTVRTSDFESAKAASEWLERAVGPNMKLLRLAKRAVMRSLTNGPLRSKAYILLADLNFISDKDDAEFTQRCLNQALTLRPSDPNTMYLVGSLEMQEGRIEAALDRWRNAFRRSPRCQQRIADLLAGQVTLDYFITEFDPDWKALEIIGRAFVKVGREDEAEKVKRAYITAAMAYTDSLSSDDELQAAMLSIRDTCVELGDYESAISVLQDAVKRIPHSYTIHYRLGLDLVNFGFPAEAAEHLQWCSARQPGDKSLRELTSKAVIERLKQTPSTAEQELDFDTSTR